VTDILTDDALGTFRRVLDPGDNSTGGGSASAIAGAMAAALAGMVARLSIRPDSPEPEAFYQGIADDGARLSAALLEGSHSDAAAFDGVVAAYRLPKGTDAEKAARSDAIQSAIITATRVPLANAYRCKDVLGLVTGLEGRSNERAKSDLVCARRLAEAALQGCLANVEINLPGIKDEAVRRAIAAEMEALSAAALQGDATK
jgi:formiminotetrahydrofolate cyclodeaminase